MRPIYYPSWVGLEERVAMLLTRKTDYALVALAGLARHPAAYASARDLAGQLQLPLPVLRNILKQLAAAGLLASTRGPSGGYKLSRPQGDISLADVVAAIEGPMQLAMCCPVHPGDEPRCRLEDSCHIKSRVRHVHEGLVQYLHQITLADIADDAGSVPAPIVHMTLTENAPLGVR